MAAHDQLHDPSSYSNFVDVQTKHLHMDLKVNFTNKSLEGSVTLDLVTVKHDVSKLILDTRGVVIKTVDQDDVPVKYSLGDEDERFGAPLSIELRKSLPKDTSFKVTVAYKTTEQCTAVQWLEPSQTIGKKHPYLYTQCQPHHARSLVPCQDTPALKLTYTAQIHAPLRALMSAVSLAETDSDDGTKLYQFEQQTKIPSYLIALVVGNLEGRQIGPRSTVWTEPEMLDKAAWEFEDTEAFIATGESLLTPYEWVKYDLLVLPPSFPFGGMENPCLTFVTPTLLAGDRSLVDVIAHEISHSWTGNLVTTTNWEHFWLNEGWTVFTERKILSRYYGEDTRQFLSIVGWRELEDSVKQFGESSPFTVLVPKLEGIDPDDVFSSVPYEKGFNLLYLIEKTVGGSEVFEPYMKAHVEKFAGTSISTDQWKAYLYAYMKQHHGQDKVDALNTIDWKAWLDAPGMPPIKPEFGKTLAQACIDLARRWDAARHNETFDDFSPDDIKNFSSRQTVVFLERLSEYPPLPQKAIAAINNHYNLNDVVNSEIRFRWQELCLTAEYEPIFPYVVKFITEQGRMKFVRPLYRLLYRCKEGADLARRTFNQNRSFYHPIAASMIAKDILKNDK